eukprot:GGOE01006237.1.p1 GENE.GGOE01006237.1~~GGOE01006237.1.p1  ORF type:complete len:380 (-),score=92.52 GGOE01006237.1:675-1814(-)
MKASGSEIGPTAPNVHASSPHLLLNEDDFKCSICLHVWHKPCVNSCGHIFCFWCLHLAMNSMGSSQCPLCRKPYTHLPDICRPLHQFVSQRFPAEAHARALDVAREEALVGVHSPILPHPPAADVLTTDFHCHLCKGPARDPTVTRCGHIFCRSCLAMPVASGPMWCPAAGCTACISSVPSVCIAMQDLLSAAGVSAHVGGGKTGDSLSHFDTLRPAGMDHAAEGPHQFAPLPLEKPFSPIEDFETAMQDPSYVHFGIICDGCGAYPIVGHRWHCRDCPEKIGFDICGECYNLQVHRRLVMGKFNQSHQPTHRMHLVAQVKEWLHKLQALHPELLSSQFPQLLELALQEVPATTGQAGEEEEEEAAVANQPGVVAPAVL